MKEKIASTVEVTISRQYLAWPITAMSELWDCGVRVEYNFGKSLSWDCTQIPATPYVLCVAGTSCLAPLCSGMEMPTHKVFMRIRICGCKALIQCLAQGRHWISICSHSSITLSQWPRPKGIPWEALQARWSQQEGLSQPRWAASSACIHLWAASTP